MTEILIICAATALCAIILALRLVRLRDELDDLRFENLLLRAYLREILEEDAPDLMEPTGTVPVVDVVNLKMKTRTRVWLN